VVDNNPYDPYDPYNQQSPQQQPPYPAPGAVQAPPAGEQPPQYPPPNPSYAPAPEPPKKKKTVLIVILVIAAVLLCCCLVIAGFAWIGYTADKEQQTTTTVIDPSPDPTQKPTPEPAPAPEPDPSAAEFADTKKVGNEKVGYVEVPSTWVNFQDLEGSGTTQFSNGIGTQIVSMDALNTDEVTAYDYAQALAMVLEDDGMEELTLATVYDIPGYEAYQVYGVYYDQGTVLVCWVFEDGKGITHYLAVEGPVDSPFELFEIPQSFTLK
jgi:ABC-type cobalt transport system substrate-binding protein